MADDWETLRLSYQHLTGELQDVRQQVAGLAQTLQALPAVGAVTLALFAALATLPAYQDALPTILLAFGLVPFVVLVIVSIMEFGRGVTSTGEVLGTNPEDSLPVDAWLKTMITDRRLEIATLQATIVRKRDRLRLSSALLAIQVGYLLVVTIAVALVGTT